MKWRYKKSPVPKNEAFCCRSVTKVIQFLGMYKSTRKRAQDVRNIVAEHYEPGRQDRCKLWIYRNIVRPSFGISERTFFRYLKEEETPQQNFTQLTLF